MNEWLQVLVTVGIAMVPIFGFVLIEGLIDEWRFRREGRELSAAFGYWSEHIGEPQAELMMEIARRNAAPKK